MLTKDSVLKLHKLSVIKYGGLKLLGMMDYWIVQLPGHTKHLVAKIYILQPFKKLRLLQRALLLIIPLLTVINVPDF